MGKGVLCPVSEIEALFRYLQPLLNATVCILEQGEELRLLVQQLRLLLLEGHRVNFLVGTHFDEAVNPLHARFVVAPLAAVDVLPVLHLLLVHLLQPSKSPVFEVG
ncbi:hypothetical protein C4546_03905 [Candidatus Parcubacteria bacterium]|nr:MAG: hypothetical protein C4546_03905 [Candidatus Parcubacteria bacterium]